MTGLSAIAALLGEPARERMVTALLDGRALTSTELALEAGVAPSTASSHLAKLCRGGVLSLAKQGRHRYFRLASPEVAASLEGLLTLSVVTQPVHTGPGDPALRAARVCYDHLAGTAGVALLTTLRTKGFITSDAVTPAGERWLASLRVELPRSSRPLIRTCLDWSERRDHLSGALGAAILDRFLALRWVSREPAGRALVVRSGLARFLSAER